MRSIFVIFAVLELTHYGLCKPAVESIVEHRADEQITLPYYGGAKGQVLQITRKPDGTVSTEIVKQNIAESIRDTSGSTSSFEENLSNIQKAAAELVSLQHNIKLSGKVSPFDQKLYAENLEKLGISAQNLAHIQQSGGVNDFRLLFDGSEGNRNRNPTLKPSTTKPPKQDDDDDDDEEDENVGEEQSGNSESNKPNGDNESVGVNVPDKESSIAEAKPVGLAIAGEGGVASSKPSATAIVGPGGLAVARPVATAIAGISPSEVSGLGISIGQKFKSDIKRRFNNPNLGKYGLAGFSTNDGRAVLVGPGFYEESRMSDTEINAVDENKVQPSEGQKINSMNRIENAEKVDMIEKEKNDENKKMIFPLNGGSMETGEPQTGEFNQQQGQYPLIPPMLPYRFKWEGEPLEQTPGYETLPFSRQHPFFPYQLIPPISPYQFYNQFPML